MDRRIEECAKLGIVTLVAPDGVRSPQGGRRSVSGPRITRVETVRQAIAAALENRVESATEASAA
jgi:hypothetical protein